MIKNLVRKQNVNIICIKYLFFLKALKIVGPKGSDENWDVLKDKN